jgi:hypothetical protein
MLTDFSEAWLTYPDPVRIDNDQAAIHLREVLLLQERHHELVAQGGH